ncbi:MAG: hypothetical protein HYS36_07210 [Candidatus Rokubacteria bacterium]|nr:hypothetical protein [Candidatus Rokubacteria bacterium]
MTRITLDPPEPAEHAVAFRWSVEPATALYRASRFTLRFPESVDLSRVPDALWWRIALICLHSQWPILRPCRVVLPVGLGPGEAEVWSRLMDAEVATLEAHRGTAGFERAVEIVDEGPPLPALAPLPDTGRCATAFSGGKDSLLHAGILTELTRQPVLVTTTSPMPPLEDHVSPRRRHVLEEVARRRDVTLIEVQSDFRAAWDNEFPRRLGYRVSVNEITDTFLYFAALLAAGVALGTTHLFLASEAEVQESVDLDGRVIQHPHCMYSVVTQRTLQAVLRSAGLRYGSLTSPLHSFQVQQLLWRRYADLRDLQSSCWLVRGTDAACSQCPQCLRLAFGVLEVGDSPARMGVDLVPLLGAMRQWRPKERERGPLLPQDLVGRALEMQTARAIQATSLGRVASMIADGRPARLLSRRALRALFHYARIRRRIAGRPADEPPGYRAGFLRLVDPALRDSVAAIYAEHFAPEDEAAYAGVLSRSDALVRWITEPIGGEA